jgi:hypothetical protein
MVRWTSAMKHLLILHYNSVMTEARMYITVARVRAAVEQAPRRTRSEPVAIASAVGEIHPADTPVAMPSADDSIVHTAETLAVMPSAVGDGLGRGQEEENLAMADQRPRGLEKVMHAPPTHGQA